MTERRTLFLWLAALTVLRLMLAVIAPPSPQEAYYFACSQHPAAAYFDGPAGMAWLIGLLAKTGSLGLLWHAMSPFWAVVASLVCFDLVRRLSTAQLGLVAALILNALPIFNEAALTATPFLPAITLALLALLCAWRAFEADGGAFLWLVAGGVLMAAAMMFSYSAVIVIPSVWLVVLCSAKHRRVGDFAGLLVFAGLPALALIPALQWNAEEEWLPIAGGTLQTLWTFDLVGAGWALLATLFFFSPFTFFGMLAAWVAAGKGIRLHVRARFVFLAALPGVVLGIYFLFRGVALPYYFLLAAPVLIFKAVELGPAKWLVWVGVGCAILFSLPVLPTPFLQGKFWEKAAGEFRGVFLEKLAEGQDNIFLIAQDAPIASIMGYYLRNDLIPPLDHPLVYVRESQAITNQFGLWPSYDDFVETTRVEDEYFTEQKGENPFVGRSALYITTEPEGDLPQTIKGAFESITLLKTLPGSGPLQEPLYIFHCVNYQTMPL